MTTRRQHHIACEPGDVADYVLLPGDPARSVEISEYFDDRRHVATSREYTTYTGTFGGVPVTTMSTGMGGPSVAIGVEELQRVGAKVLIRVGTAGSMQPDVNPGDFVVATGAIRDEGTGRAYVPAEFPAVADPMTTHALYSGLLPTGRAHLGVIHTKDSFYGQKEPDRMPVAAMLRQRWQAWVAGGSLASEMESATLFVVASVLRLRAATACLVASSHDAGVRLTAAEREKGMETLIRSVLAAVVALDKPQSAPSANEG
ncbi:nucleoside phosphorylase [Nonomuraea sp. NPDC050790]|uniref:nucleoside phosphorylase n=1 Tax=Nonomuraea sp. NPDC050790 TaxID=3364371 RepID=UPI0037B6D3C8